MLLPIIVCSAIRFYFALQTAAEQLSCAILRLLRPACCCAVQVNTWRLAAEQAADLAEAANQRAASCECKLADSAQQLAAQARATLKLGEELRQARGQLDGRWAG